MTGTTYQPTIRQARNLLDLHLDHVEVIDNAVVDPGDMRAMVVRAYLADQRRDALSNALSACDRLRAAVERELERYERR